MRVWLVTIGEPLPFDAGNERLLRAGILADMLARRGHTIVWWNSTFNHSRKTLRAAADTAVTVAPNYVVRMLHGGGYRRNISLARLRDHRRLARRFAALAPREPRPDVILCSFPPIELSHAAVEYGRRHGVPVILDVRDLWPDIFADAVPRALRPLARLAIHPLERRADACCAGAYAVWGHVPAFVDWGLRRARRGAGRWDRHFPFGYTTSAPPPAEVEASRARWAALGVGSSADEFVVAFIGAVGHQVDLETVVDAAERVGAESRIRFVICGDGDRLEALRARAAHLPHVVLAGWRARADVWTLLRMASVGLAPYAPRPDFLATISNKIPEYLSARVPIALSLSSGVAHDLIRERDCGFAYDGDAARLAERLVALRDAPERMRALRANAAAVFDERFDADRVYGAMIATLEEIVAATAARPPAEVTAASSR